MSDKKTKPVYKVHPAIGVARLGNSPSEYYISPETTGGLPIEPDPDGNAIITDGKEQTVSSFKDDSGRIKRQAARFRIHVYDQDNPEGRELKIGDTITGNATQGTLVDIQWTVYLANKKAVWYQFKETQGEHGYAADHPLRNPGITSTKLRQQLIIDPGPQSVWSKSTKGPATASFSRDGNPYFATVFPPPLLPNSIDTLGELRATVTADDHLRLLVLGGFGNSGTMATGFGAPHIDAYANNDGWFDDISDGPVMATLLYKDPADNKIMSVQVTDPGWVITGYPRYAPEIVDMITMDDLIYDLSVQQFGYNPYLYGTTPFQSSTPVSPADLEQWKLMPKDYNPDYYPYFFRDIWPILQRPYYMQFLSAILGISNAAHETGQGGDFFLDWMAQTPNKKTKDDPYKTRRTYVNSMLRLPGEENQLYNKHVEKTAFMYNKELMPLLNGDNPLSNTSPSKFLRLTDTQLFILQQWAMGKFINEKEEDIQAIVDQPPVTGTAIDRGVLGNVLGGAFCPGAELNWIARNPAIYSSPYRIKPDYAFLRTYALNPGSQRDTSTFQDPLSQTGDISNGLQPGDLTKYSAQPWQSDFNECSLNVTDITYELWNELYPDSTGDNNINAIQKDITVLWWPAHRPMEVYRQTAQPPAPITNVVKYSYDQAEWARGIPQTHAGDLKMVTEWNKLGFVVKNTLDPTSPFLFVETEYTGNAE